LYGYEPDYKGLPCRPDCRIGAFTAAKQIQDVDALQANGQVSSDASALVVALCFSSQSNKSLLWTQFQEQVDRKHFREQFYRKKGQRSGPGNNFRGQKKMRNKQEKILNQMRNVWQAFCEIREMFWGKFCKITYCDLSQQLSARQPLARPSSPPPVGWGEEWTKCKICGLR